MFKIKKSKYLQELLKELSKDVENKGKFLVFTDNLSKDEYILSNSLIEGKRLLKKKTNKSNFNILKLETFNVLKEKE